MKLDEIINLIEIIKESGENTMTNREYAKTQIDRLPEGALEKVVEFITFQKFSLGLYDDDTDYLMSIPGMKDKIIEGLNTPLSDCVPLSEVWGDV